MKLPIAYLVLKGDRLILEQKFGYSKLEFDVTGVWHFFKEFSEHLKTPQEDWEADKIITDSRDYLIRKQAQESLLEEIHDIAEHHESDSWSEIKNHLTINKPK